MALVLPYGRRMACPPLVHPWILASKTVRAQHPAIECSVCAVKHCSDSTAAVARSYRTVIILHLCNTGRRGGLQLSCTPHARGSCGEEKDGMGNTRGSEVRSLGIYFLPFFTHSFSGYKLTSEPRDFFDLCFLVSPWVHLSPLGYVLLFFLSSLISFSSFTTVAIICHQAPIDVGVFGRRQG